MSRRTEPTPAIWLVTTQLVEAALHQPEGHRLASLLRVLENGDC